MTSTSRWTAWLSFGVVWAALAVLGLLLPAAARAESRIVYLSPAEGPATGGTHVTIRVDGGVTMGPLEVRFGGRPASRVFRVNISMVEAVTPPGDPGPTSVEVISGLWGTQTAPATFTYLQSAPTSASAPPAPPPAPPQLLRLEPDTVVAGSDAVPLRADGDAFGANSALQVGETVLPTTVVSPQQLEARLPAALLDKAQSLTVQVTSREAGGAGSNTLSLSVINPIPEMTVLEVPPISAGAPATAVTVRGRDFRPESRVQVGEKPVATTYKGPQEMSGVLPADVLAAPGRLSISVTTPGPGGGTSNPAMVTIQPPLPGRFIVFTSTQRGGHSHLYLLDRITQKLDGLEEANSANATDDSPSISADGRLIVFQSDRNHRQFDVFLFDRQTRKLDALPELNSATAFDGFPRISPDGRFIVFESDRLNGRPKVFLFDRETRTVSAVTQAGEPTADNGLPAISN